MHPRYTFTMERYREVMVMVALSESVMKNRVKRPLAEVYRRRSPWNHGQEIGKAMVHREARPVSCLCVVSFPLVAWCRHAHILMYYSDQAQCYKSNQKRIVLAADTAVDIPDNQCHDGCTTAQAVTMKMATTDGDVPRQRTWQWTLDEWRWSTRSDVMLTATARRRWGLTVLDRRWRRLKRRRYRVWFNLIVIYSAGYSFDW